MGSHVSPWDCMTPPGTMVSHGYRENHLMQVRELAHGAPSDHFHVIPWQALGNLMGRLEQYSHHAQ